MKGYYLLLASLLFWAHAVNAQVYLDQFDNDDPAFTGGAASYSFGEANDEWTITANNPGAFDAFTYDLHDPAANMGIKVDMSANNKIFIRAKASAVGTQLRLDVQDSTGYLTSLPGLTKTLSTTYQILEFDFSGIYQDGGYGGTPCSSGPCAVDSSVISRLVFYTDPGVGGFTGTVVIDYIAFGSEPSLIPMSDVFQDHFDTDSSINSFSSVAMGYNLTLNTDSSTITISGDGTMGPYDPLTYIFRNSNLDTIDLDVTANNKMYVKVKSSMANTALRMDLQDINGFITTQGSITKIVGTDYTVLEYDFTGTYSDLGYGGTPCTAATAPCPVDGTRIGNITIFIEPGAGMFLGDITIDYISFGTPLEAAGPEAVLLYEDHFNNETVEYIGDPAGLVSTETGSDWIISGDGSGGAFSAVSYILHDKNSGEQVFLDMAPALDKVFVRARVDSSTGSVPLRLDILDTAGYVTSIAAITKVISSEYEVYEYNFSGNYFDGGFGGSPCTAGPCPVDPTAITQMLLYPDPAQGGFNGEVYIDFVSIGQPAGEDMGPKGLINYSDQMDDNTSLFLDDIAGLTSTVSNDEWIITGDGSSGQYAPVVYSTHNDVGELILIDALGSNNKLFVRAKASVDSTVLRVDLQDNAGYLTNLSPPSATLGTDYAVYELDFTNAYEDGAYGGSPCMTAPCPVDAERIEKIQMFIDPGVGGFAGTLTIDWLSFGATLTSIETPALLNAFIAYPNPVNSELTIEYDLATLAEVELSVYNSLGNLVKLENTGITAPGNHRLQTDLKNLSAGMYFLQLKVDGVHAGTLRVLKQ
ncbi:MAG: T9SS type A sorting domain-containing protein [Bacteroidota bacterium]